MRSDSVSRRTPQACRTCRRRKTKCDGAQPQCRYCSSHNITCEWPSPWNNANHTAVGRRVFASTKPNHGSDAPMSETIPSPNLSVRNFPAEVLLPSQALLQRCISLFFEVHFVVDCCSFFYEANFVAADPHNLFLVASIISLTARYLNTDDFGPGSGYSSRDELYRHFTDIAKRLARESSDMPCVSNIHGNIVLSLSEIFSSSGSGHWMYAGTAIRMAQIMRLNKEYHEIHPEQERETRRRTYWACLQLDRLLAFLLDKPQTLLLENLAISLPSSNASLAYGEPSRGLRLENIATFAGTTSELGLHPYLLKSICLWGDLANFHVRQPRTSELVPPTDPYSRLSLFSTALTNWIDQLPVKLRWSHENYAIHLGLNQDDTFIAIHCILQSGLCVAHQDYLPQTDGSSVLLNHLDAAGSSFLHREPSLVSTCVSSALTIGNLVSVYMDSEDKRNLKRPSIFVALAMLSAASSLLWLQHTDDPQEFSDDRDRAQIYFENFRQLLKSWREAWKVARVWLKELEQMRNLYMYAYNGEVSESTREGSTTESRTQSPSHEDGTEIYRPRPGDGLPQCKTPSNLHTLLQLNHITKLNLRAEHRLSVWLALTQGWRPGDIDNIPLDTDDLIAMNS